MEIGDKVRIITKEEFDKSFYPGTQEAKDIFYNRYRDWFGKIVIYTGLTYGCQCFRLNNNSCVVSWDKEYLKPIPQEPYKWMFTGKALYSLIGAKKGVFNEIDRDCSHNYQNYPLIKLEGFDGYFDNNWLIPCDGRTQKSLDDYKVIKEKQAIIDLNRKVQPKLKTVDNSKRNELAISFIKGFCSNSKYPSIISTHNDEDEKDSESLTKYRKDVVNEAFLLAEEVLNKINNNE